MTYYANSNQIMGTDDQRDKAGGKGDGGSRIVVGCGGSHF